MRTLCGNVISIGSGPLRRLVDDLTLAWQRWDERPGDPQRAGQRVDALVALSDCLPGARSNDLHLAIIAERRTSRMPVAVCIEKIVSTLIEEGDP